MPQPLSEASRILGARIRDGRRKLALSQDDIANLAQMNVSNYGKIERGLSNPTFHTVVRIASVLGVNPGSLIDGLDADSLPESDHVFTARDYVRELQSRVVRN